MIRAISWNVNGIRSCAEKGLFAWLAAESPDMLCLQETKAQPEQLAKHFHAPTDGGDGVYKVYWSSAKRKGYSGVAIYTKREPRSVSLLGIDEFDDEGRFLAADYGDFVLISAYFPNSQDLGARLDYKIRYCDAVLAYCDKLVAEKRHFILSGDYNIAHKPIDLAHPEANEGNAGYLPEERAWMDKFTGAGHVDTFRRFNAEPNQYTWWTYRVKGARERNVGWRLDYHCVDAALMPAVKQADIHPKVLGSDHCPVSIELEL